MFSFVLEFANLPENPVDGEMIFVSRDNNLYVYASGEWKVYEDHIKLEKIAEVSVEYDFDGSGKDSFVFDNTIFFDKFKHKTIYILTFSCAGISSSDKSSQFDFSLVNSSESPLVVFSAESRGAVFIKKYYYINMENVDKFWDKLKDQVVEDGFNVKVSNAIINSPITISLYGPPTV